jgi:MFS family permease
MVGMGETYFAAFAMALGHGQVAAGLIATLPLFLGAVVQLGAPAGPRWLRSHKRWVVGCVALQAAVFAPLIAAAWMGHLQRELLFALAALYWAAGYSAGPAWMHWVATIIPSRLRARYFSRRARVVQLGTLVGLLAGGAALHWLAPAASAGRGEVGSAWPFGLLFAGALACRVVSALRLARQSEPERGWARTRWVSLFEVVARMRAKRDGRLLLYLFLAQAAAQLAAPYFTPYMLRPLALGYGPYVGLIAAAFLARVGVSPLLGEVAHRYGANRLMWIGGVGIVPVAALWLVTDAYAWLALAQALAGCAWAAFELGAFLLFFDAIREDERASVLTVYQLTNAAAMLLGSIAGGLILRGLGGDREAYAALFLLSTIARAVPLGLLGRLTGRRVREIPKSLAVLAVRPAAGILGRPLWTGGSADGGDRPRARRG